MLVCNNIVSFEHISVLANGTNDFRIKLQESLLIHRNITIYLQTFLQKPISFYDCCILPENVSMNDLYKQEFR